MDTIESYTNEKGQLVVISEMENSRLIHAIAKYAAAEGKDYLLVKVLKAEAFKRLSEATAPRA